MAERGDLLLAAVILAAGSGSRMPGKTKQLLPVAGKPLLQHVINAIKASTVDEVLVVIGHDADRILATIDFESVNVVVNERFADGQSTSLQKGVEQVSSECSGAIIVLGDQPGVATSVIDQIAHAFRRIEPMLLIPLYRGERGNPVVIHRALFPEVLELTGDTGARALFGRHRDAIETLDLDLDLPPDIDTMDEYRAAVERASRQSR